MSISKNNSVKSNFRQYWTNLAEQRNDALLSIVTTKPYKQYGQNQDFVSASIAALMPKVGYVRSETVNVYFREFKVSYRAKLARELEQAINKANQLSE